MTNTEKTDQMIDKTQKVEDSIKDKYVNSGKNKQNQKGSIRQRDIKKLLVLAKTVDRNKQHMTTIAASQAFLDRENILKATLLPTDKNKLKQDLKAFINLGASIIKTLEKVESRVIDHDANVGKEGLYQQMIDQTMVIETIMGNTIGIPEHCFQSLENDLKAIFDKYNSYR